MTPPLPCRAKVAMGRGCQGKPLELGGCGCLSSPALPFQGQPHPPGGDWGMETACLAGKQLACSPSLCSQLFCCQKTGVTLCYHGRSHMEAHPCLASTSGKNAFPLCLVGKFSRPAPRTASNLPEGYPLVPGAQFPRLSNKKHNLPHLSLSSNWYLFLMGKKKKTHLNCWSLF